MNQWISTLPSTGGSSGQSDPRKPRGKSTDVAAIVGGVIGGASGSTIVILAVAIWRRHRSRRGQTVNAVPFVAQPETTRTSSKWQRFHVLQRGESASSWTSPSDSTPVIESTQSGTYERSVVSSIPDATELPTLVRRLHYLLQGRQVSGELPPLYEE